MTEKGERLVALDGLRGVAALSVLLYHVGQHYSLRPFPRGYLAVDFFFVLSGFVISCAYREKLVAGMTVRHFLELRAVRMMPLFVLGVSLGIFRLIAAVALRDANALGMETVIKVAFCNLLLLPSFVTNELFPSNQPGWSLFFELCINVIFAAMLIRLKGSWLILVGFLGLLLLLFGDLAHGNLNVGWDWATFYGGAGRTLWAFIVGVIISRSIRPTDLGVVHYLPFVFLLAAALIATFHFSLIPAFSPAYDLVAACVVAPLIVYAGAKSNIRGPLAGTAAFMGDLSYPLYAIHYPLLLMLHKLLLKSGLPGTAQAAINISAVLLAAYGATIVDSRVRAKLSQMLHLRRTARAQALAFSSPDLPRCD